MANLLPSTRRCGFLILYCVMCLGMLPQLGSKFEKNVSDSSNIPYLGSLFGAESQQKLLFVPDADSAPDVGHEISEPAIFRFLLNEENLKQLDEAETIQMLGMLKDIDKQSKITQAEIHQSSMGSAKTWFNAFHVFIVFKSTSETAGDGIHWWSLEKNSKYIVLQRSRNKENVKDKLEGKPRTSVELVEKDLKGKGTIKDLFAILWADQVIEEKYHLTKSNCQSLVTFVGEQITEIRYKYKGNFPYSPPLENDRKKEMLDFINILAGRSDSEYQHSLITVIKIEKKNLFDKIVASGKYDINALYNGLTPLHLAIENSEEKMFHYFRIKQYLTASHNEHGRRALLTVAKSIMKREISDLLLAHEKGKFDYVKEEMNISQFIPSIFPTTCQRVNMLFGNDSLARLKRTNGQSLIYWTDILNGMEVADVNWQANFGLTPRHKADVKSVMMGNHIIDLLLNEIIDEGDIRQYRNDNKLLLLVKQIVRGLEVEIGVQFYIKGIEQPYSEKKVDEYSTQETDAILNEGNVDSYDGDQIGQTFLYFAIRAEFPSQIDRHLSSLQQTLGHTIIHRKRI